jgi:thiol-disulfide isomerase/thioredoxin
VIFSYILPKRSLTFLLYGVVALAALGAGVYVSISRHTTAPPVSGADAIFALQLPDLENKSQSLKQWRGKVLIVNFWATWCAPCREEIPVFVKMQENYRSKGLQFVGISIDQADKTLQFASNFGINYPTLVGSFDTVEVSRAAGNQRRGLPFTIVLNRKGDIVATELGGVTREKLESIVKPLL